MATNKNALRRYMIIDRCIRNSMSPFPSRDFLQKKVSEELWEEISVYQIDKDISSLKNDHNAPIEYDRNRKGYYYSDDHYSFRNSISEEDLWVLDFAAAAVQVYGHSHINEKFTQLSDRLNTGTSSGRTEEEKKYSCIEIEGSVTKSGYEWLFDLYLFINTHQVVAINYMPFGRSSTTHTISPYLLKQYQNRWYLIGFSEQRSRTQIFALDRILQMEKVKNHYTLDPDFDPVAYFRYSYGIHHSQNEVAEKVRLWFSVRQKPYLLTLPLHHSQQIITDDENGLVIEVEIYCRDNNDFLGKLLSYGDEVSVGSPAYLKEILISKAKSMLDKYGE
jgi:predicted DNA-binding transcriptional regulator YafY